MIRTYKALFTCKVLDILFLQSGPSFDECRRLINKLIHFAFPEFDPVFLQELKSELPTLIMMANTIHYNFEGEDAGK